MKKKPTIALTFGVLFISFMSAEINDEPILDKPHSRQRTALVEFAKRYLNAPYRAGGDTPKGFDCSGFVWFVYHNAIKMEVPRSSRGIWASKAKTVKLKDARPGDILVFSAKKGGGGSINHVAILVDKNTMIHALSDGPKLGIAFSPLTDNYFSPRFVGIKSFIKD